MPGQESGGTPCGMPGALSAKELLARVQELVDAKPAEGGYSLEFAVAAYYLGDLSALATLNLRGS